MRCVHLGVKRWDVGLCEVTWGLKDGIGEESRKRVMVHHGGESKS